MSSNSQMGKNNKRESQRQSDMDANSNKSQTLPKIGKHNSRKIAASPSSGLQSVGKAYKNNSNTFGGTARSMSVVPIPANRDGTGATRKAIREGIDMLEAKYLQKDGAIKANALEARIKRLVFEENRAKKLTEIANEKAEKLLKARDRH